MAITKTDSVYFTAAITATKEIKDSGLTNMKYFMYTTMKLR